VEQFSLELPIPNTLEGIQAEIGYWTQSVREGMPGSPWDRDVNARLEALRSNLQIFLAQQNRTSPVEKSRTSSMTEDTKEFRTAFARYKRLQSIGEGGSGRVFKVEEEGTGKLFAVKYFSSEQASTEKVKRFKNELFFSLKNTHKNILTAVDYGMWQSRRGEVPFYVMPFYPKTLKSLMKEGQAQSNAENLISQLLDGVEAAHLKGIWHRDLKPENILIDESGKIPVVADWGAAHFTEAELHTLVETSPHTRLANFYYAAPEQRRPGLKVDARADIYALGLIINEIFTGEIIQGHNFKRIADVSQEFAYLDAVVERMVQQSADARISSVEEVKKQLLAHRMAYVSRQKLDSLRQRVIPSSEPSDPLIETPVKLISVDYRQGVIYLKLNHSVSQDWIQAFQTTDYREAIWNKGPENFQFQRDTAYIDIDEGQAQKLIDDFKRFLELGNEKYRQTQQRIQREREEAEREQLRREVEQEELRQRMLKNLRF
jgi:serine/threonine protein kinase